MWDLTQSLSNSATGAGRVSYDLITKLSNLVPCIHKASFVTIIRFAVAAGKTFMIMEARTLTKKSFQKDFYYFLILYIH